MKEPWNGKPTSSDRYQRQLESFLVKDEDQF